MNPADAARYGTARAAARAAQTVAKKPKGKDAGHGHHAKLESVREADHKGHHIVVKTKYSITVDGKRVSTPLHLTNDGQIRCHALPNYTFSSAIDLVKQIINAFPEEFTAGAGADPHGGHDGHGGHGGHGTHGSHRPARRANKTARGRSTR